MQAWRTSGAATSISSVRYQGLVSVDTVLTNWFPAALLILFGWIALMWFTVRRTRTGVALYCVDDRRLDLVATGDLDRWAKGQARRRVVLSWSRRVPLVWNRVVRRLVAS